MNWGRWVADCPRVDCASAERFGPDPTTNVMGGLTETSFHCQERYGGCGMLTAAHWPNETDRAVIEMLLGSRPVPATRNWAPGESIQDLLMEGIANGLDFANDIRQRYGLDGSTTEYPPAG